MTRWEQERAIVAEAVVGAWRDEGYRERLITDGAAVLRDAGLELPAGCRVVVVENTDSVWHLAIPRHDLAESDRERFLAELAALLPLPAGVELHLHQDTGDTRCVVLPLPPGEMDALDDEELRLVVGGGNGGNGGAGGISGTVGTPLGGTAGTGGNGGDGGASILFGGNGGTGAIT